MPPDEPAPEYDLAPDAATPPAPPASAWNPRLPLEDATPTPPKPGSALGLTGLFMVIGAGLITGTILFHNHVEIVYGPTTAPAGTPFTTWSRTTPTSFSPTTGATWSTPETPLPRDIPPFTTIDMVATKDKDAAGNIHYHYYSSKPPLLPTCAAGVVIAIEKVSAAIEPAVRWVFTKITTRDLAPATTPARACPPRSASATPRISSCR